MVKVIKSPSVIKAAGTKGKIIKEFIGKVNSKTSEVSIAMMKSPKGWEEPGQTPEFNEYTLVLEGKLKVCTAGKEIIISRGETIVAKKDEWVKYSTPFEGGAEYIAVCAPAFSPETVHRDDDQSGL
ncbi:MAG: cupin [Bacteroidia bacterium]|nr:cupin [Bacteroidia bacterium]